MAAQDLWFERTAAQRSDQCSQAELDRRPGGIRTIRGYLFKEKDGTLGTICRYEATGSQVIHVHGRNADVAVSEIRRVAAIDVHRPRSRSVRTLIGSPGTAGRRCTERPELAELPHPR